jgi:large subunit ribosomal protein L6
MSRVGKLPVNTKGATVKIDGQAVTIKGPKGELNFKVHPLVNIEFANDEIVLKPVSKTSAARMQWGTARATLNNMVKGVSEGYTVELIMQGTGYRANVQGNLLSISVGYSHEVKFGLPKGITAVCPQPTEITISGADKQMVGQIAAEIRAFRKPEPYKGKGIRRKGEYVRRKEGKKK